MLCMGLLFLAASPGLGGGLAAQAASRSTYRHAYYLFLADRPKGCEDCYVPLLITAESLEHAAKTKAPQAGVLIVTYERDSIWHDDGMVSVAPGDIEAAPRIIRFRGRRYRYQELSSAEVLKLLEKPMGTIPISRPYVAASSPPSPTLGELIAGFREAK